MTDWLGMGPHPRTPRAELRPRVLERALRMRRPLPWGLAAAAVLAVAIAAGVWSLATIRRLSAERGALAARLAALEDTLALIRSPGSIVLQVPVSTGGRVGAVTIFADRARRRWLVACHGLAPNTPGEAYQLWFVTERGMRSAALMPMDGDQPMWMALELPPDTIHVMGAAMSIERRSGATEPKGPVVFHLHL